MSRKIEYIDFAKGYAIFTIVIYHALQRVPLPLLWQKAIVFGGTGVHLFFLLSGFGLALSKTQLPPLQFYRRRLAKVWLPYVLALTISLLAAIFFGLFPDRLAAWTAGVLLYQMFVEPWIQSFGGHFWFISAIMQFYLVFPVLAWAKNKWGEPPVFAHVSADSVIWWLIVYYAGKGDQRTWNSFFLQFLWEFALGMVLANVLPATVQSPKWLQNSRWNNPMVLLLIGVLFTAVMILMIFKLGDAGKIFMMFQPCWATRHSACLSIRSARDTCFFETLFLLGWRFFVFAVFGTRAGVGWLFAGAGNESGCNNTAHFNTFCGIGAIGGAGV